VGVAGFEPAASTV